MKRILLSLALLALLAPSASATLLLYDGFDLSAGYSGGALKNQPAAAYRSSQTGFVSAAWSVWNDTSVVYRLDCQNLSVLFLGDSEYVASGELEALDPALLRADIVQVGHHGCGNVSKEIYRRIGAKIGIFQLSNHYWYSDFGEGLGTHNTGVTRTIAYLRTLGMPAERLLTDLDGIVSLPLSIGIDGIVSSLEPKGL